MNDLVSAMGSAWQMAIPVIMNLLTALCLFLLVFIVGRVFSIGLIALCKAIALDELAVKVGFKQVLQKGGIKHTTSELLADGLYWSVVFIGTVAVAEYFQLAIGPVLTRFISFVGLVFLASIILGIGVLVATLISGIVRVLAANFGIESARTISKVVFYLIVLIAFLVVLEQFGIRREAFMPQLGVIIGAVGLAAAIAFGLGCKDMAADFFYGIFKGK
ncbi:MAG: hypothetical protein KKC80_06550 [Candidatus Margulisbacteria bacterium]|nr:hypothetical protein [Candidatus Margulisiibacteriota bacterium]